MTTLAPWLTVPDGDAAADFYRSAFGAEETYRLDDGGSILVARFRVGDAEFWIQTEPGVRGDDAPARMILTVDDPDAWFTRAVQAGAAEVASVHEEHGWRTGRVRDPAGHDWEFSRPAAAR
jgi:PhnB protein